MAISNECQSNKMSYGSCTTRNWTFTDGISDGQISVTNYWQSSIRSATNVQKNAYATEFRRISKRYDFRRKSVTNLHYLPSTFLRFTDIYVYLSLFHQKCFDYFQFLISFYFRRKFVTNKYYFRGNSDRNIKNMFVIYY